MSLLPMRLARTSWDDVRRRARRSRQRRIVTAVAITVVGVAIAAPAVAIGGQRLGLFGGGTPVAADALSPYNLHVMGAMANGTSPRVPASQREDMDRFSASSLRQIAERDGHTFFVARRREGGLCVSVGVTGSARVLGSIVCSPDFPSPRMPILDRSTVRGSPQLPASIRLRGVRRRWRRCRRDPHNQRHGRGTDRCAEQCVLARRRRCR